MRPARRHRRPSSNTPRWRSRSTRPLRSGNVSCLKPVDAAINEAHWYFNALGDGWFDENWRPIFNDAKGVQAIEMMKEITHYAQQGFSAAANDECMIAYQQDTGVMGLQWATRAKAMDDPAKSRVINKIDWAVPPLGHQRISGDGYAISAFSKQDPDTLFRIIATSADQANMRGAASLLIPPRKSLLDDAGTQAGQSLLSRGSGFQRCRAPLPRRCRNSTRSASSSPAGSCRPSTARCRRKRRLMPRRPRPRNS